MAYCELIKNFEKIRSYMRDFYVFGFKTRNQYARKSLRSYDDERRRIESWLGDYMSFNQTTEGRTTFISMDSRDIRSNPLYNAFKAKSFTKADITLHFYILDILADNERHSIKNIMDEITDRYLSCFEKADAYDESTVRKKLKEYVMHGLIESTKQGNQWMYYLSNWSINYDLWKNAIAFFAQENPLGVVGSYLEDRINNMPNIFSFKHFYPLHALDIQVTYNLLNAINDKRKTEITVYKPEELELERIHIVFPFKIYISTQSGRQYLMCYNYSKVMLFRLDNIHYVNILAVEGNAKDYEKKCAKCQDNMWGVATNLKNETDHIEMLVKVKDDEQHIINRMEREKRCGKVKRINDNLYSFSADIFDAYEMMPWIRTFIGRIVELHCSNIEVVNRFYQDLAEMKKKYEGENDDIS